LFARQLARSSHRFSLLSCYPVGGLLVEATAAHLPEHTFTLHSLLQNAKCLLDIIVSDEYLHRTCSSDVDFVVVDRAIEIKKAGKKASALAGRDSANEDGLLQAAD
jgi:hypothetical protein